MASVLFSPIELRGLTLPNRITVSPMCQYSAADGNATDWHMAHLGQLALSGAGLLITEAAAVERRGRITHGCLGLYSDDNEEALRRVIEFCNRHGKTPFGVQLAHSGRKGSVHHPWIGSKALGPDEDPWETVSVTDEGYADWPAPKMADAAEMKRLTEAFVQATIRSDRLGVDLIEYHNAHGYLGNVFLSPLVNTRTDAYGGSFENRIRFPLEVFEAMRKVWPADKPMGVRIPGSDWVEEGGWSVEDAVKYSGALKEAGADYVVVSSGGVVPQQRIKVGPGYQVAFAAEVKAKTGITTMAVGMITDPHQAEEIIESGKADMVALARSFLYNPRWAWHAAETLGAPVPHYPDQYLRAKPESWPHVFPGRARK
ncbi:MAG: NADH:flavin oxidoreductase/NADH oxidase [Alphaproteobacteria bacterium]|nr:NADH:flavin oxidoreductase/NADH oxidase [Alphaproteobacteria bacterium]MBU0799105.1 NADH:flavin oxidoreductase/NADH oxidase [Alphaproteobacteria bacterium]MBU0888012.1 NADH:flavin oxidoreductase/NADH oxidase [Alphaproteobacteria bacterium]MBU1811689.1 NADH:flavin oxidoreductase/NADH oxidase [Alphaproteobacteria bacterium]